MNSYVLDASALLAVLNDEEGSEGIIAVLSAPDTIICAVNYSEVVGKLALEGMPEREIEAVLGSLGLNVVPFDQTVAYEVGLLHSSTRKAGLSLGDRACLALSKISGLPALTADKAWIRLGFFPKPKLIR